MLKPAPAPPLKSEAVKPGMRIGLFGGTFDPPHAGHLHAARTAMRRLRLDRVWWLVSPQNPLKARQAGDLARRMDAVRDLARDPGMVISDIEARLGTNRTIDLLGALKARHRDVHFVWMMGADNLAGIHRWADWQGIFSSVPVAVIARPTDAVRARLSPAAQVFSASRVSESQARSLAGRPAPAWTYLTARLHPHSSTALRERA
ncbi:nicotinate-nucleotide adenylyltransferase [Maricaulis sp.]|uniref:nicotinate-nucleotide adenylyltransferase n=1 Tax=Maricaulis sp. TaxID=1486257 RepID=UPI00260D04C9|nr:nicotinate-nucleotide adenylyltransferase [Maricaulis sp.]